MKKLLLLSFIFLSATCYQAQTTNAFRVNYNQANLDLPGNATESLTPNQYVFAGSAVNFIPIYGTVTELDNAGNMVWSRRYYDGSFGFQLNDIKKDQASNEYFVCGGSDLNDGVFMRLGPTGNVVMSARFSIDEADGAFLSRMIKTSDGNYLAVGYVTGHNPDGAGPEEYFAPITYTDNNGDSQTEYFHSPLMVKFDPSGNVLWHHVARYYKTAVADPADRIYNDAYFRDVVELGDGYMAVGSYKVNDHLSSTNADGDDNTPTDATIFKTDLSGNITFHKQVDNPNIDPTQTSKYLSAINKTSAGDPIAGGYTNQRELVMKYGALGGFSLTFSRRFTYSSTFFGTDPVDISQIYEVNGSTDIATMGMYIRPFDFEFNNSLHRMNGSATSTVWAKKYSFGMATILPRGQQVSDGGYIMSSTTMGATFDYQLIKTDPNGDTPLVDCPPGTFSPAASAGPTTIADPFYKTWAGTTGPIALSLLDEAINPTPNFICQAVACTPPDEATTVTATPNPICEGESTVIDASGPGTNVSYNVYDAASGGTNLGEVPLTVSPTTTTTYYIETFNTLDPSCVSVNRVPIEVTVNPAPTADPSAIETALCEGDDLELTATAVAGGTYDWQGPNGFTSTDQNPVITNVTTANEGTYTLIVTANGCPSAPATVAITVSEQPTSNPSAIETTLCEGEDLELTANTVTGGTYNWQGPNGFTSSDQNPVIPNVTTAASGIYTLQITVGTCSSTTEEVTIVIEEAPTATADNDGPLCSGQDVTITATGGGTYNWEGPNGYISTNQNNTITGATINEAGTYTVVVTNAAGCTDTAETIVVIGQGPDLTINGSDISCFGLGDGTASVSATGTGPFSYNWIPTGGTDDTAIDLEEGTYEVEVTDADGCISTESILINEPDEIILDLSSTESDCTDDTGTATVVASGGAGGFSYQWDDVSNQTTATATAIGAGIYEVVVTDADGCSASGSVTVNSLNGPTVTITDFQHVSCFGGTDGSATADATGGTPGYTFAWTPSGGSDAVASDLGAGTYQVTVTDEAGCTAVEQIVINEPDELTLSGASQDALCGNFDGQIDLTVEGGTGVYTYNWTPDELTGNSNSDLGPGDYSVVVVDENGCEVNGIFTVGLNGNIPIDVIPDVVTIEAGETVDLDVIVGGGVINETYSWTPSDGLSCNDCPNPIASPDQTTTYVVTVTTDDGCISTDSTIIVVDQPCTELFVPTIFSPNGDGINDVLCVYGSCVVSLQFDIYNRWGERVFSTQDQSECWDGTYKGKMMNTATFAYKLKVTLIDGQEIEDAGNINLVR